MLDSVLEHTCYLHTCLWKLGNVFQVERQLKAPFVCPYNKKKAVEEAAEIVYKAKKRKMCMKILLITYLQRERESACMNRGGGCSTSGPLKAGKVSGKWANTGLLGALDARLDDSAPASDGISYAELTVVTSQLFDMRAAHMYIHRFICILQYYIYVRFQLLHVCNANRSKGASG